VCTTKVLRYPSSMAIDNTQASVAFVCATKSSGVHHKWLSTIHTTSVAARPQDPSHSASSASTRVERNPVVTQMVDLDKTPPGPDAL
jgi:hypothetical protein